MLWFVSNKLLEFIIFFSLENTLVIAMLPCYKVWHALFIKVMIY